MSPSLFVAPRWIFPALLLLGPGQAASQGRHPENNGEDRFQWEPALVQSTIFLGIQHSFRLVTEPGTRSELKGPFFRDWGLSVKQFGGWGDRDPFLVNYIGHPMMGAATGFIQVQNDPRYRRVEFGSSELYFRSRLRALAYSAVYSAQFEFGPLSEASIGNVGKDDGTMGAVDLVVTPIGGLGFMVAEDALDRYVVRRVEQWTGNRVVRLLVRSFLNPNRSFANTMRLKYPWHRDTRGNLSEP